MRHLFLSLIFLSSLISCTLPDFADVSGVNALANRNALGKKSFSLLQANVGNSAESCRGSSREKLCQKEVMNRISSRIKTLNPDVVFFQELMPPWLCGEQGQTQSWHVCSSKAQEQSRQLLGSKYTLVCDPTQGWSCVGLKHALGDVLPDAKEQSCPASTLCGSIENHVSGVRAYEAELISSLHNPGFHIMMVPVQLLGRELLLINAHPQNGKGEAEVQARNAQLQAVFERLENEERLVLMAGDFNFDPFRSTNASSVALWQTYVDNYSEQGMITAKKRFRYLSGPAEKWPAPLTTTYPWPIKNATLDHVLAQGLKGSCQTLEGEERLDGGNGTDHRALFCQVRF